MSATEVREGWNFFFSHLKRPPGPCHLMPADRISVIDLRAQTGWPICINYAYLQTWLLPCWLPLWGLDVSFLNSPHPRLLILHGSQPVKKPVLWAAGLDPALPAVSNVPISLLMFRGVWGGEAAGGGGVSGMQELLLIVWGWMVAGVTATRRVACVSGREGRF